jgi:hypothetical protein
MDAELADFMRETRDRQEIYDCMMRYCRGIDRFDRAIIRSAYHDDAVDDHGSYVGPVEGFLDYAFHLHGTLQSRTQHMIVNHSCDLDGDTAHTESYYIFRSLNAMQPWHSTISGRYIDRLERREGRWGIVARICTVDIRDAGWDPNGDQLDGHHAVTSRSKDDPSYMRPLVIDPARFTV